MPEDGIRLADRSEFHLSCWIVVHVWVILFTKLTECLVNGGPKVEKCAL
jgi:hypothetical protein